MTLSLRFLDRAKKALKRVSLRTVCVLAIVGCLCVDIYYIIGQGWVDAPDGYLFVKDTPLRFALLEIFVGLFVVFSVHLASLSTEMSIVTVVVEFFVLLWRLKMSGMGVSYTNMSFFDNTCKGIGVQNCPAVRYLYENALTEIDESTCSKGIPLSTNDCPILFHADDLEEYSQSFFASVVSSIECAFIDTEYVATDTSWCYYWGCAVGCSGGRRGAVVALAYTSVVFLTVYIALALLPRPRR